MKQTGLLGISISNSLSPFLHNTAYSILGIPYHYGLFPVVAENITPFLADQINNNDLAGFNVTMPYKQLLYHKLTDLTPQAALCGSVNTVYRCGDHFMGDTTDGPGFLLSLSKNQIDPAGLKICILGSGGACRSILSSLAQAQPSSITVIHRSQSDTLYFRDFCRQLAKVYQCRIQILRISDTINYYNAIDSCDLLVNTTSLGYEDTPLENSLACPQLLHNGQIVYDIIYHPWETTLLKSAHAQGCGTINGFEMLLYQASLSHEIFTGTTMPVEQIRELFNKENLT